VLFNDTIYSNLLLGRKWSDPARGRRPRATPSRMTSLSASEGHDTWSRTRRPALRGQKQRVALPAPSCRNAPILDPGRGTSRLDSDSEAAIQAALKKLVAGKTC